MDTLGARQSFTERVAHATGRPLRPAARIDSVQVNIGLVCNLACLHCHVESGPKRTEEMSRDTMNAVLRALETSGARTLDITGGAPEMHPHFRWFVEEGLARGAIVIVRTNLTILLEPGYQDLPGWFAERRIHLVASLPCYTADNVDRQRGRGTYDGSIAAMRVLNAAGYGRDPALPLDLVYNPLGASLPGPQAALEDDYRRELRERWDLHFTRLLTITNMPIGRFATDLRRAGRLDDYDVLLRDRFNAATVERLMCRHQMHVAWDGRLYDCDFNYALAMGVDRGTCLTIDDFDVTRFVSRRIVTDDHCFGCTAGAGSSCGGALATG
jgi:radical SAM/Cys-rich protein